MARRETGATLLDSMPRPYEAAREVRCLAEVDRPNVITICEFAKDACFPMELVDGVPVTTCRVRAGRGDRL